MTLPKSVQEAADQAAALQQQLVNPSAEGDQTADPSTPPLADDTRTQAPPEPAGETSDAVSAQADPQSADPAFDQDAAYWQHRFQVLQGKYNAEVPALRAKLSELEKNLAEAHVQRTQEAVNAQQRAVDALGGLSQEEMEEYGPELIEMIQRVSGAQTQQLTQDLSNQLHQANARIQQFEDEKQQDVEARFWTELDRLVPDWQALNGNTEFLSWLDGFDPVSTTQRQVLLNNAQQQLNAHGVAAVFNAFKQAAPPAAAQQAPAHLQQPSRSHASESILSQDTRLWTRGEITQFYTDAALGKYPPDEKAAIEKDIFEAQRTGRVRG